MFLGCLALAMLNGGFISTHHGHVQIHAFFDLVFSYILEGRNNFIERMAFLNHILKNDQIRTIETPNLGQSLQYAIPKHLKIV